MDTLPAGQDGGLSETNSTIRIDMDGLFGREKESTGRISLENLELKTDDILNSLTHKPPEKYQFRGSLGRGGMKLVIQVKDKDTTRDIAMALLPDAANRPKKEILRFIEEARITASLEHPNIVPVHDIGIDSSGSPYFTMKLMKGETLASVLKKVFANDPEYVRHFTLFRLLRIYLKVCNAVAFAHSRGVLHLDLKPENIQVGDFGEVLLMDWGLAKVISATETQTGFEKESEDMDPGITRDGVTKGTPGYMAPEQAAGLNSAKDFRTDVYALGAILYAITTGKNPLDSSAGIKQMMLDTVAGNIIPPRERAPERAIPAALEAVILKAMSVKPEDRYSSVGELRDEVSAFLGGFATVAERASSLKKGMLFFLRHKVSSAAVTLVVLLLLGFGVFLLRERKMQRGDWIPVYENVFTDGNIRQTGFSFYNSMLNLQVPAWHTTQDGLKMARNEWMWLTGADLENDDLKIELDVMTSAPGDSLTICMQSPLRPLKYSWQFPTGYSVRIAGHSGAADLICRNETLSSQEMIAAADSGFKQGQWNKVIFERNRNVFTLTVNKQSISVQDLFPIVRPRQGWIGFRSSGVSVLLRSLSVYRLALPEKASPVIAGDTLLENRHYGEAVEKYLMLADSYIKGAIAEESLVKAYHTAITYISDLERRESLISAIRERIESRFPQKYRFRETIMEIDALQFWKTGKYMAALQLVEKLFQANPNTSVVPKLLQFPHKELPENVLNRLMQSIARTRNLKHLNISGFGIRNLLPLQGMDLVYLDCSGNRLTSLTGIESMPLEVLICQHNQLTDLNPLSEIPIKTLDCSWNSIAMIDPVQMGSIKSLLAGNNRISMLTPLSDAYQLEVLELDNNLVSNLDPLSELAALKKLNLSGNPVTGLNALSRLSLESLILDSTAVSDLTPILGQPLSTLSLQNCRNVTDVSSLRSIDTLETLYLPYGAKGTESLRQLPALQYIHESAP